MNESAPHAASAAPRYAVVFTSLRSGQDASGYAAAASRMVELAAQQPGFLGVESARDETGMGITVSYWRDLDAIRLWRSHAEHQVVQSMGRSHWYRHYHLCVCRIESETVFDAALAPTTEQVPERPAG